MKLFRSLPCLVLLLLQASSLWATHNRAGEICYRHLGGTTFEFTVITYTFPESPADRDSLNVVFDSRDPVGTLRRVGRTFQSILVPGVLKRNEYTTTYTFPGPDIYVIYMEDPNRVEGVCNIDGSVNVPFYLEDTLNMLNPVLFGYNSSPMLLYPPIDYAQVGQVFIHNPNAFDPDGDSLHYSLIPPKQAPGIDVPGYRFPDVFDGCGADLSIDARTGELVWDTPCQPCIYNVAILIREFRGGRWIGSKIRDLQIFVEDYDNRPPEITALQDTCIIAGELLEQVVSATDPDLDVVTLSATGGPFAVPSSPAVFFETSGTGSVSQLFRWQTNCSHVRKNFYQVVFRATDDFSIGPLSVPLTDLESWLITVVAPPPTGLTATPIGNRMELRWDSLYACFGVPNFQGFSIWRKLGCDSGFVFESCQRGLEGTAYEQIAFVESAHRYTDFDVTRGPVYAYRVVAEFAESPEGSPALFNEVGSRPSDAACAALRRDLPVMTHASVEVTDPAGGEIFVAWVPPDPDDLDTLANPGPYRYELVRSPGFGIADPEVLAEFITPSFAGYEDTTFLDTNINTQDGPFAYDIRFFASDELGNEVFVGEATAASSIFLSIGFADNALNLSWAFSVPWFNWVYEVYREEPTGSGNFVLLDTTDQTTYTDQNLANGQEFCYYIRALGTYGSEVLPDSLINLSQRACGIPQDTVAPCPPVLTVNNVCTRPGQLFDPNNLSNDLNWSNPNLSCADDVVVYNIFYGPIGQDLSLLATNAGQNDTTFRHENLQSLAGCYAVTAVDSVGNESALSNVVCVDNCPRYELPNAFTPNGDGNNDLFTPFLPFRFIESIDIQIFNRWGALVYQTNDPAINWDGTHQQSGQPLAEGVYYYTCTVVELRTDGTTAFPQPLEGFIHLIRGNGRSNP
jgi:gliding motility-associated-like protein